MIQHFIVALERGKELANAETWKNRTVLFNTLVAFLPAVWAISALVGFPIPVDPTMAATLIASAAGVVNIVMTIVTSSKVGLPPKE